MSNREAMLVSLDSALHDWLHSVKIAEPAPKVGVYGDLVVDKIGNIPAEQLEPLKTIFDACQIKVTLKHDAENPEVGALVLDDPTSLSIEKGKALTVAIKKDAAKNLKISYGSFEGAQLVPVVNEALDGLSSQEKLDALALIIQDIKGIPKELRIQLARNIKAAASAIEPNTP